MKIDKKLIKELVDHLSEFNLTELEYQEGQTKVKVSKASKGIEQIKSAAIVSPNKAVLNKSDDSDGIRVKSPIIGDLILMPSLSSEDLSTDLFGDTTELVFPNSNPLDAFETFILV